MKDRLSISVVINTFNRAKSLKSTLESLIHQTDGDFEVIVVNGPSTDETEKVLDGYRGKIKSISCPVRNLSVSRNLGIEASSGDIVAFIDDDALADPNWIRDLIDGYDDSDIGGVGGLVYDHTGMKLQYRYSACDRKGETDFNIMPPFDSYCEPCGEKFLYLQGTNCSFRKSCLEMIGGFDEEFEYYLDEVDVCMRIIDLGYKIKPIDSAFVHHKYMKSFLRNEEKVVLHPYSTIKNRYYFAIKNSKDKNLFEVMKVLECWTDEVKGGGNWNLINGKMTQDELNIYLKEVEQACRDGEVRGKGTTTKVRKLTTQSKKDFLPFSIIDRKEKVLKICYMSKEYPPKNFGGIGRYTYDLATTFAAKGHEVHVITEGEGQDTVDFEDGVWVHRLVSRLYEPFENMTLGWNLSLQARNYFELERIHKQGSIDIVNGPIWLCESGMANCSRRYPTVMTLMTTQKILNGLTEVPEKGSHAYKLMNLEEINIKQHKNIHAISHSIMNNCKESMQDDVNVFISPLGCRDLSENYIPHKSGDKVIVYSVGRLEHRKGTDLLLKAAENILAECRYDNVEFVIAGKETTNTISGVSFREEFQKRNKGKKGILDRVKFMGEISEDELMQNYADADIACTPSRYESFGIVLLEGMSFTNAIVAADVGGMKDIVKNGSTGLFFESDNVEDLTTQLKKLLDQPEYRKQVSEEARRDYLKIFSLDAVYKDLYKKYLVIVDSFSVDEENPFNCYQFAEMIATAEDIKLETAEKVVKELLQNQKTIDQQMSIPEGKNLPLTLRILRKMYRAFKKVFPFAAVKIRNKWLRNYYSNGKVGIKGRIRNIVVRIHHFVICIPIFGWFIKYFVDILLIPLRIETIANTSVQLLNNDELLRQIGGMVENQSTRTRDVVWYMEEKVRTLEKMNTEIYDGVRKMETEFETLKKDDFTRLQQENQDFEHMLNTFADGVKNLHYDLEDYNNRVFDRLNQRLTDVRSEILFEILRSVEFKSNAKKNVETKIVNISKVEKAQKEQKIKLNIGAGHICFNDYLNVDEREINNIDVVADIRKLPFEKESVDEIYASHLIEHFRKNEFVNTILPYWISMLKRGGKIRVVLPDLESMIKHYNDKDYDIDDMRDVIYGLQEYPGDIHYALYGQQELKGIFEKCNLKVEYAFKERKNGKCYDMELISEK